MQSDAQEIEMFSLPSVPENPHPSSCPLEEKPILPCRTTEHYIQYFMFLVSHYLEELFYVSLP